MTWSRQYTTCGSDVECDHGPCVHPHAFWRWWMPTSDTKTSVTTQDIIRRTDWSTSEGMQVKRMQWRTGGLTGGGGGAVTAE